MEDTYLSVLLPSTGFCGGPRLCFRESISPPASSCLLTHHLLQPVGKILSLAHLHLAIIWPCLGSRIVSCHPLPITLYVLATLSVLLVTSSCMLVSLGMCFPVGPRALRFSLVKPAHPSKYSTDVSSSWVSSQSLRKNWKQKYTQILLQCMWYCSKSSKAHNKIFQI